MFAKYCNHLLWKTANLGAARFVQLISIYRHFDTLLLQGKYKKLKRLLFSLSQVRRVVSSLFNSGLVP